MLNPFILIFFLLVFVWQGAIFITSDPAKRIERACVPTTIADKVVVAVTQLVHEPYAMGAHEWMLKLEYGCQFMVWKTFYEDGSSTVAPTDGPTSIRPAQNDGQAKENDGTTKVAAKKSKAVPKESKPVPTEQIIEMESDKLKLENAKSQTEQSAVGSVQGVASGASDKPLVPNYMDSK